MVSVVTVAGIYKQYKGAIPWEIARLMVAIDMYLTGDGLGAWNDESPPPPPAPPPGDCQRRRQLQQDSFTSDQYAGAQPLINRPLLMSRTAGLSRSLWSLIISKNTFQRDRFERGSRFYFAPNLDWIIRESGIANHRLNNESESAFRPRTKCDDSCKSRADDKCSDGGVFSDNMRNSPDNSPGSCDLGTDCSDCLAVAARYYEPWDNENQMQLYVAAPSHLPILCLCGLRRVCFVAGGIRGEN